jgi:putative phosphoesterase
MKIAFISDIHGNYEALKTVLSEIDKLGISHVYCAGDVVGYYTQINECCNELRLRGIPTVMGNHDWYMAGGGFCPRSKSVNDCLVYQRKVIEDSNLEWLRALPVRIQIDKIHMVHGGWADPIDEYLKPTQEYFDQVKGEIFVSGHSHIQSLHKFINKVYCNPGSVGQPRDGDPRAAFAVFDGNDFKLHRVEYDMQNVFELMDAAGFNDYYYGCLKTGARNLCKL